MKRPEISLNIPLKTGEQVKETYVVGEDVINSFPSRISSILACENQEDIRDLFEYANLVVANEMLKSIGEVRALFNTIHVTLSNGVKRTIICKGSYAEVWHPILENPKVSSGIPKKVCDSL